jgi:hypothetical protein
MPKPLTPQQKKELEYDKDHYVIAEYPHGFRKSWPKKKRFSNQAFRHKVAQALSHLQRPTDAEEVESEARGIARKRLRHKWGVVPLRERVAIRLQRRRARLAASFFSAPYLARRDRGPFAAFLDALMTEKSGEAAIHARIIKGWLGPAPRVQPWPHHIAPQDWLKPFFEDEPHYEARLSEWIEATLRDEMD